MVFESFANVNGYQENLYCGSSSNVNQLRNNNNQSSSKLLSQLSPLPSGGLFCRQLSAHADLMDGTLEHPPQTQVLNADHALTTTRKQGKLGKCLDRKVLSPGQGFPCSQ
jgi:hypothetical protein